MSYSKKNYILMNIVPFDVHSQDGFTLIELMVSLVLGLLISAAAFQVFYISQRTSTTQSSASEVQDGAVFGLHALEHDIRLTNLRSGSHYLNKATADGGIVLSATNVSAPLNESKYNNFYTKQEAHDSYYKTNSDQLTIQFVAPENIVDCEGNNIGEGTRLVQRYFLRNTGTADKPSYALACDAAIVDPTDASKTVFGDDGAVIIPNVDQFKVWFLTENGYKDINGYNTIANPGDLIYGIKLGLILSGGTPTVQAQDNPEPTLLGVKQEKKSGQTVINTVRRVYEPTIILRNTRIE